MAQKKIEKHKDPIPKILQRIRKEGEEESESGKRVKTIWHAEF